MATNDYHFITDWRVEGSVQEVADIIGDAAEFTRWWPSVYLDIKILENGDETGLGKMADLYTKGWLPYTLRWQFRVNEVRDDGFSLIAHGDFEGRGIWTFKQDGPWVDITYDWKLSAEKPLLRYLSFIMKPIFAANHRWAMAKGEESLRLELARRHAKTELARAQVPAPPQPTRTSAPLLMSTVAAIIGVMGLSFLFRKVRLSRKAL
jgi:hypothetical protein